MRRAPAAALAVLAAALLAWLASTRPDARHDTTARSPPAAPAPQAERTAAPTARTMATASATSRAPLPSPSAPLRESFVVLDAEARRGHAEAACRLVTEIDRCASAHALAKRRTPLARRLELIGASGLDEAEKQRLREKARSEETDLDSRLAHCEGFDPQRAPPTLRYLALAARAGHRPARLLYLLPTSLIAADLIRDPALVADYRATAPAVFHDALEAGDIDLLMPWSLAVESMDSPLASLLPEELRRPGMVQALREELEAAGHVVPPRLTAGMVAAPTPTPEEAQAARALFDAHFRDAVQPPLRFSDYLAGESLRCEEAAGL